MKIKQFPYVTVFLAIFGLLLYPSNAFADGKYPVRISSESMVVFPVDETTAQIVQSMSYKNNGTKTEEQLPIYLPENYADLQLGEGLTEQNTVKTSKGIVVKTGLDGGEEKQFVVTYKMPMFDNVSQWSIGVPYVADQMQVIIQPGVLSFSASDLIPQSDLFEMNNQKFRRFTRLDLHPDQPWTLSFKALNESAQDESPAATEEGAKYTEDGMKIIGGDGFGFGKAIFVMIIIVVALTAALIGLKRDLLKTTGKHRKVKRSWLVHEKQMLLQEIVELEKDYQSNLLTESTYKKTREQIRDQLIRITMELD
ncbi:hypothetical protein [Virgibacillus oceani]|uniref:Uncharacterized protein n=1 Tax=Virgibacillus oceani TaxID=1479511 RepID=A0A917GYW4_9BACI|nr:hypothetical protein [Virgibacillus oceani]GGG61018.1 hypothetical protein GCM10011398_00320 [Virgibacillus oceani]